jgi:hypothetical protein
MLLYICVTIVKKGTCSESVPTVQLHIESTLDTTCWKSCSKQTILNFADADELCAASMHVQHADANVTSKSDLVCTCCS